MMPSRSPRSARALGMLVLAAAFVAGALAATAAGRVLYADPPAAEAVSASGDCENRRVNLLDQLELTQDQRARIDGILERRRGETDRFWSDAGPKLSAIMDSTRAEIRSVLTPAQREEYDRIRAERKAAKDAERKEAGHGGID